MEKLILKSDDFLDGQNHTFNFGSVKIERSIRCLSVYAGSHYLELFGNWQVVGIYENEQAETPQKVLIKAHKRGDVIAVVEVDLSRRLPVSTYVTETQTRQKFIGSSEMLAEGEKTIKFGWIQVSYANKTIRVVDRYLKAELFGLWNIKDDLRKIEINVSIDKDDKIGAHLSLRR